MTKTTKTYSVILSGRGFDERITLYLYNGDELVSQKNWGRNAVGAHFDALSQGYTLDGSPTAAYREALATFNGDR